VKEPENAYGRLVLDYFEHGRGIEIVERDDGSAGGAVLTTRACCP
jgi:hypothetical protein